MLKSTVKSLAIKAAALIAVAAFLFMQSGCSSHHAPDRHGHGSRIDRSDPPRSKPRRKRASDYSRIPNNTPAEWQHRTLGR